MQTQAMSQYDFDLAKFIKLMKMTTATVDGEALNAIRMANKMLRNNGHDWEVLLKGKIIIIADPFASIPTPPPPRQEPVQQARHTAPPYTPPPPPPPPQRVSRNRTEISVWIQTISAGRLAHHEQAMLQAIEVEWNHFAPALKDSDYNWLRNMSAALTPKVRSKDDVEMIFDVLDLSPLSRSELQMFREIKAGWTKRANGTMGERDFNGLLRLYNTYKPRGSRTGKAKRLF